MKRLIQSPNNSATLKDNFKKSTYKILLISNNNFSRIISFFNMAYFILQTSILINVQKNKSNFVDAALLTNMIVLDVCSDYDLAFSLPNH